MSHPTESESGQLLTIQPCGWYLKLQSDRDHLAGVVKGMEEQNARNLEALDKENIVMRRQMKRLIDERDALLKVRDELIDIAHGQTMFDEFNKRYTHSFMSDGEALWRLLGFDDKRPYIPEAEFDAAGQRFKDKGVSRCQVL